MPTAPTLTPDDLAAIRAHAAAIGGTPTMLPSTPQAEGVQGAPQLTAADLAAIRAHAAAVGGTAAMLPTTQQPAPPEPNPLSVQYNVPQPPSGVSGIPALPALGSLIGPPNASQPPPSTLHQTITPQQMAYRAANHQAHALSNGLAAWRQEHPGQPDLPFLVRPLQAANAQISKILAADPNAGAGDPNDIARRTVTAPKLPGATMRQPGAPIPGYVPRGAPTIRETPLLSRIPGQLINAQQQAVGFGRDVAGDIISVVTSAPAMVKSGAGAVGHDVLGAAAMLSKYGDAAMSVVQGTLGHAKAARAYEIANHAAAAREGSQASQMLSDVSGITPGIGTMRDVAQASGYIAGAQPKMAAHVGASILHNYIETARSHPVIAALNALPVVGGALHVGGIVAAHLPEPTPSAADVWNTQPESSLHEEPNAPLPSYMTSTEAPAGPVPIPIDPAEQLVSHAKAAAASEAGKPMPIKSVADFVAAVSRHPSIEPEQAEHFGQIASAILTNAAARVRMTPEEFLAKHPLSVQVDGTITGEDAAGKALAAQITEIRPPDDANPTKYPDRHPLTAPVQETQPVPVAAEQPMVAPGVQEAAPVTPSAGVEPVKPGSPVHAGEEPGYSARVPTSSIAVDPSRFQYKVGTGQGGVAASSSVPHAKTWNPDFAGVLDVWKDPADGKTYVVNGHNRLSLAKRLKVGSVNVHYIDAPDAATARSIGALKNIAEGQGTAIDAGKFFRDSHMTAQDLADTGVSLKGRIASDGRALANLHPALFDKVANGQIPEKVGVVIGAKVPDESAQLAIAKQIEGKNLTTGQIAELADRANAAPKLTTSSESLFGNDEQTRSLAVERAKVADALRSRLSSEGRLFATTAKNADRLERGSNVINAETSNAVAEESRTGEAIFNANKNAVGPLAKLLDAAAVRLGKGENAAKVYSDTFDAFTKIAPELPGGKSLARAGESTDAAPGGHAGNNETGEVQAGPGAAAFRTAYRAYLDGSGGNPSPRTFGLSEGEATSIRRDAAVDKLTTPMFQSGKTPFVPVNIPGLDLAAERRSAAATPDLFEPQSAAAPKPKKVAPPTKGKQMGFGAVDDDFMAGTRGPDKNGQETLFQGGKGDRTDTPEFKKWFGNSKIVDESGKPLVVWRGEDHYEPVNVFDRNKVRDGGIFTTPVKEAAESYANTPNGARPFHVSAQKVLDLRDPYSPEAQRFLKDYKKLYPANTWEDRQTGVRTSPEEHLDRGDLWDYEGNGNPTRWRHLFNAAEKAGYDAVWANDHLNGHVNPALVVFRSENLKHATDSRGTFDPNDPNILHQGGKGDVSEPFYSHAERVIEAKMGGKMPADQLGKMLLANGVKPDEMHWSGLDDLLAEGGTVTKAEVLEHLRANRPDVQVVSYGGEPEMSADATAAESELDRAGYTIGADRGRPFLIDDSTHAEVDTSQLAPEEMAAWQRFRAGAGFVSGKPKFDDYQLRGGNNYREHLLKLPVKSKGKPGLYFQKDYVDRLRLAEYGPRGDFRGYADGPYDNQEGALAARDRIMRQHEGLYVAGNRPVYTGRHWDEPNVVAHVRMNDRTGPNGEKILHVEEIQSDHATDGRDNGFVGQQPQDVVDSAGLADRIKSAPNEDVRASLQKAKARIDKRIASGTYDVPRSPYVEGAGWHELALRHILRHAAENGYDRVSWTPGEDQNARYDLSKHVDKVVWTPNADGTFNLGAIKDGQRIPIGDKIPAEKIEDYIGKEPAKRLLGTEQARQEHRTTRTFIEGDDLKVGGSGMKGFYDKIVPDYLNKYGKRWGAKVEPTTIEQAVPGGYGIQRAGKFINEDRYHTPEQVRVVMRNRGLASSEGYSPQWDGKGSPKTVPSIPITPSMRESVMHEGQPLFQSQSGLPEEAPRASIKFTPDDGHALITLARSADISSAAHEFSHFLRRSLDADSLAPVEEHYGVENGHWTVDHEERFANDFERYVASGKAPKPALQAAFERFAEWMRGVYAHIKGSPLDEELHPAMRKFFDDLVAGKEGAATTLEGKAGDAKTPAGLGPMEATAATGHAGVAPAAQNGTGQKYAGEGTINPTTFNLDRMDTTDDVRRGLIDNARDWAASLHMARRGVIRHADVVKAAGDMGLTVGQASKGKPAGMPIENWVMANRDLMLKKEADWRTAHDQWAQNPTPQTEAIRDKARADYQTVAHVVAGNSADAARALGIHREIANATRATESGESELFKPLPAKSAARTGTFGERNKLFPAERAKAARAALAQGGIEALNQGAKGDRTDTPEFKNWFGNSKVVDESGKPLVVYHAGGRFDSFSRLPNEYRVVGDGRRFTIQRNLGSEGRAEWFNFGASYDSRDEAQRHADSLPKVPVYFASPDIDGATTYADGQDDSEVKPLYLRMQHPLDLRDPKTFRAWTGNDAESPDDMSLAFPVGSSLYDRARAAGHDGVIHYDTTAGGRPGLLSYAFFDGTQAKLAPNNVGEFWPPVRSEGNRGTYDPNDPNILHQSVPPGSGAPMSAQRLAALTEIGGFHLEGGLRNWSDWSAAMHKEDPRLTHGNLMQIWNNVKIEAAARQAKAAVPRTASATLVDQLAKRLGRSGAAAFLDRATHPDGTTPELDKLAEGEERTPAEDSYLRDAYAHAIQSTGRLMGKGGVKATPLTELARTARMQAVAEHRITATPQELKDETISRIGGKLSDADQESFEREIGALGPDDHAGFARVMRKYSRMSVGQSLADLVKAGYLSHVALLPKIEMAHAAFNLAEEAKRLPASLADMAYASAHGTDRQVPGLSVGAMAKAARIGATKGVAQAATLLREGETGLALRGESQHIMKGVDIPDEYNANIGPFSKAANAYVRSVGRTHGAIYHVNKVYGLERAIDEEAQLAAMHEAKEGANYADRYKFYRENPTTTMIVNAANAADELVFQNQNVINKSVSAGKAALGPARPVADALVPFVKVHSNVFLKTLEYGFGLPLGSAQIVARELSGKVMDAAQQRAWANTMGRGAVGAGVIALGAYLHGKGHLAPADPKKYSPATLKVDGKYYPVSDKAPIGTHLAMGATIARGGKDMPMNLINDIVSEAPMSDTAETVSSVQKNPAGALGREAEGVLVPGFAQDLAGAIDAHRRRTTFKGNFAKTVGANVQAGIPGWREKLPASGKRTYDPLDPLRARAPGQPSDLDVANAVRQYFVKKGANTSVPR